MLADFLAAARSSLTTAGLHAHITEPGPELGVEVEMPGRLYAIRVPSPGPYPMEVWVGLTVASPVVFGALREREEVVSCALGDVRLGWNSHPGGGGWLGLCQQVATSSDDLGRGEGRAAAARLRALYDLVEAGNFGEPARPAVTSRRSSRARLRLA